MIGLAALIFLFLVVQPSDVGVQQPYEALKDVDEQVSVVLNFLIMQEVADGADVTGLIAPVVRTTY